jgi:hypothetical protein
MDGKKARGWDNVAKDYAANLKENREKRGEGDRNVTGTPYRAPLSLFIFSTDPLLISLT